MKISLSESQFLKNISRIFLVLILSVLSSSKMAIDGLMQTVTRIHPSFSVALSEVALIKDNYTQE